VEAALAAYRGLKVQMVQDEYDLTENTRRFIERHGTQLFFTVVPEAEREKVYPPARFPGTEFVSVLTGYVPMRFETRQAWTPMRERKLRLGYRGRALPPWYGHLGREKQEIGERMRAICDARSVPVDIEWDDSKRIYGESWYKFIGSVRATLGTESGANVFDDTGAIRAAMRAYMNGHPRATYDELWQRFLAGHEGRVRMNQCSPRLFEAIATGTALVLYEGDYSGVVEPGRHYIALAKDHSNVEEVLAKLEDVTGLEDLTERTYREIVGSGRYSYRVWGRLVGEKISQKLGLPPPAVPEPSAEVLAREGHRVEPCVIPAVVAVATPVPFGPEAFSDFIRIALRSAASAMLRATAEKAPMKWRQRVNRIMPARLMAALRRRLIE
jgi:hypothetical protein